MTHKNYMKYMSMILIITLIWTSLVFTQPARAEEDNTSASQTEETGISDSDADEEGSEASGSETEASDSGIEDEDTEDPEEKSEKEELTEVDLTDATSFSFSDTEIQVSEGAYTGYEIEDTALTITGSGIYVLSGSCENGTIVVKENVTEVTLVLDGLELTASGTAPLVCETESEVLIFVMEDTVSSLSDDEYNNDEFDPDAENNDDEAVTGDGNDDEETEADNENYDELNTVAENEDEPDGALYPEIENAVIKCKDGTQVTICGTGTLQITANGKNGIKSGANIYEEEEDEDGNVTETLVSAASLTIKELTLDITANVTDALKADQELNILSGNIMITASNDGIKSGEVLNIGSEDTDGPTIEISEAYEGIEAAELNIYSGEITVNATDDGINAANSRLEDYEFSYNQFGGTVYVNVCDGDGIDSNGTINLNGGILEIYSSESDGDPLDSDDGTYFCGTTVLAAGHLGAPQGYRAEVPYVVFGEPFGGKDGFGPIVDLEGENLVLVTAESTVQILDTEGEVLYAFEAVRDASYILFSCPELEDGAVYSLEMDGEVIEEAAASMEVTAGKDGRIPRDKNEELPDENDEDVPGSAEDGKEDKEQAPAPEENQESQTPAVPENDDPSSEPEDENDPASPENEDDPNLHENDTPIG